MHIRTITAARAPQPASAFSDKLTEIATWLTLAATVLTAIASLEGLFNKS